VTLSRREGAYDETYLTQQPHLDRALDCAELFLDLLVSKSS